MGVGVSVQVFKPFFEFSKVFLWVIPTLLSFPFQSGAQSLGGNQYFASQESATVVQTPMESTAGDDESLAVRGEEVNYPELQIQINIPARRLDLIEHQKLVKSYPIAVGQGIYPTPVGPREMDQIVWNPWWIPPKGSAWAANSHDTPPGPHNPLGPVKMRLGGAILLHGTNKPDSVGTFASHGCMRMHNEDAQELAWRIQQVINGDDASFLAEVSASPRRSFYVKLAAPVPIDIVYAASEVAGDQILLHPDRYGRARDRLADLSAQLAARGYETHRINWEVIQTVLKDKSLRNETQSIGLEQVVPQANSRRNRHTIVSAN